MKIKTTSAYGAGLAVLLSLSLFSANVYSLPSKAAVAGDSITMGFGASCKGNVYFWDLFCLLGGDQPQHSWFDGTSNKVNSIGERYAVLDSSITANKNAAQSGTQMRGGSKDFAVQAAEIVAQSPTPDHVEVELGGNDICNRGCTDPSNCNDPVYTNGQWRQAVREGLDVLVNGLPNGSTVYLGGVPRVQDLRAAGLAKQSGTGAINCESIWSQYNICRIATHGGTFNGETHAQRFAALQTIQRDYNQILRQEADAYNKNTNGKNPRGIEVFSNYRNETATSTGTFSFQAKHINGGDCFHPSFAGQNKLANLMWNRNPDK